MTSQPEKFTIFGADVTVANPCLVAVVIDVPWDVNHLPPTMKDRKFLLDKTALLACYLIREGHMANPKTHKVNFISLCKTKIPK